MRRYNINNFSAIADGKTLNTETVQKAVSECSANGGDVVRFDRGRYALSTVFLNARNPQGTEILGAESYYDYAQEEKLDYPEAYAYGRILPAKGIYFRHIEGLQLENVTMKTYFFDVRADFVFKNVGFGGIE